MDPYSAEGELITMHDAFHQGRYNAVICFDTSPLSHENIPAARILQLRARVALGQADQVLVEMADESTKTPELEAVEALALQATGKGDEAVKVVERLAESEAGENGVVQVLGGAVLAAERKGEEALALLGRHSNNLEAVALMVQIHLQQNRNDLAVKEVAAARRWAQDSLLVNLAESWVGLRLGGEKYQQAFYVFEELAQNPSTTSARSFVGQAVAELLLGRHEEAQVALEQALQQEKEPGGFHVRADAVANQLVLSVVTGRDSAEYISTLEKMAPKHPLLTDLAEKGYLFDKAATKYEAKVAAA